MKVTDPLCTRFDVSVTIVQDAPPSADWTALWQRLLAPPSAAPARAAPTSDPVNGAPDVALEAYIAAELEAEAR
jgi:hypothetical protein